MPPRTCQTVKSRCVHHKYRYSAGLSAEMRAIFASNTIGTNRPASKVCPPVVCFIRASGLPGRDYFFIGRKAAGLLLRIAQPAIDRDLEHAADPWDQFDLGAVFLFQHCPRTEGARLIVSGLAPIDSDLHG